MRRTRVNDFMPKLRELYPEFTDKQIKQIIRIGCYNMLENLKNNDDVLVESSRKKVKFLVYHYSKK